MVKPRIFVSSTFYDLKHVRSSLELFIDSLGFDPVLSEKGDITYMPDAALEESCYREAAIADIFVLIIGGRYGSEAGSGSENKKKFYDQYDSITRREYETAYEAAIPIFVLIEKSVHAEFYTYLANKADDNINYAHVESVNVFRLIEFIYSKRRNNPIYDFERSLEIENWLKEQWSGLFRELLRTRSQQAQLLALSGQVGELKAIGDTLKNYMESVLKTVNPETSDQVIAVEEKRLLDARRTEKLAGSFIYYMLTDGKKLSPKQAENILVDPNSFKEAAELLQKYGTPQDGNLRMILEMFARPDSVGREDYNEVRRDIGLPTLDAAEGPFSIPQNWTEAPSPQSRPPRKQK